jgi:hypothetical protein
MAVSKRPFFIVKDENDMQAWSQILSYNPKVLFGLICSNIFGFSL